MVRRPGSVAKAFASIGLASVSLISFGLSGTAWAGPLDPNACAKLAADAKALDDKGVQTILSQGPAASKGNLTREQRDQVRSYLDLVGQLRFRCPNDQPLVTLRPEVAEDPVEAAAAGAPIEANSPGITLPPGIAAAVVAPIVPQKPPVPKAAPKAAPKPAPAKSVPPAAAANPAGPVQATPAPAIVPAKPKPAVIKPAATPTTAPPVAPAPTKAKTPVKPDDAFKPAAPVAKPQQ